MICVHCGNDYPVSEGVYTCPACGKTPSRARLFLEAEGGDADAMFLSALHFAPEGEEAALRRDLLHRSALGGCRAAALTCARELLEGPAESRDPAGAKAYLLPYVKKAPAAAMLSLRAGLLTRAKLPDAPPSPSRAAVRFLLAREAEAALDYPTALALLKLSAQEGDAAAEEALGVLFEEGRIVTGDRRIARNYYVAACRDGSLSAYVRLGDALRSGTLSDSPEPEAAFECYRSAAEAGLSTAQVRMADCCFDGVGCPVSVGDALAWYRRAASKGEERAKSQVAHITSVLDGSFRRAVSLQERGDAPRAVAVYTELADMGHAEAANRLGYCLQHGIGTDVDRRGAARRYEDGARGGSLPALYNLGICYAEGIGVAFDYCRAVSLLGNAVERGFPAAQAPLDRLRERRRRHELRRVYALASVVYRRGEFAHAARLLLTAAEMGSPVAAFRLACQLRFGDGVGKNETTAALWEARAREAGFTDGKRILLGYLHRRREQELLGRL